MANGISDKTPVTVPLKAFIALIVALMVVVSTVTGILFELKTQDADNKKFSEENKRRIDVLEYWVWDTRNWVWTSLYPTANFSKNQRENVRWSEVYNPNDRH